MTPLSLSFEPKIVTANPTRTSTVATAIPAGPPPTTAARAVPLALLFTAARERTDQRNRVVVEQHLSSRLHIPLLEDPDHLEDVRGDRVALHASKPLAPQAAISSSTIWTATYASLLSISEAFRPLLAFGRRNDPGKMPAHRGCCVFYSVCNTASPATPISQRPAFHPKHATRGGGRM